MVKQSVAESIASIALYIESEGLVATESENELIICEFISSKLIYW